MDKERLNRTLENLFGDEAADRRREAVLPSFIGRQVIALLDTGQPLTGEALGARLAQVCAASDASATDRDLAEYAIKRLPLPDSH